MLSRPLRRGLRTYAFLTAASVIVLAVIVAHALKTPGRGPAGPAGRPGGTATVHSTASAPAPSTNRSPAAPLRPAATVPARAAQTRSTVTAGRGRPTTRPSAARPPTAATSPARPVRTPPAPRPTGSSPRGLLGGVAATICGLTHLPAACPTP